MQIYTANQSATSNVIDDPNWSISINNTKLTEDIEGALKDHIHTQTLFHHLVQRKHITAEAINLVAWDILSKVHCALLRSRYIWVVKYALRFLPTANHMHRNNTWETNLCPLCHIEVETNLHIMRCSCDEATMERHSRMYDLYQWLIDNNTNPNIIQTVIHALINGPATSFSSMVPIQASSIIQKAACEQDCIRWDNFVVGRLSLSWAQAQQQYFDSISSNPKDHHGSGWLQQFILRIYDMGHKIWMY